MDELLDGQIKLYVADGIDGCVVELLGGRIDEFKGYLERWVDGRVGRWVNEWKEGWVDGWMF